MGTFLKIFALLAITRTLYAANPGDEVIVIYNSRVPESKSVADYYAERRHVPASQIFGFDMTPIRILSEAFEFNRRTTTRYGPSNLIAMQP